MSLLALSWQLCRLYAEGTSFRIGYRIGCGFPVQPLRSCLTKLGGIHSQGRLWSPGAKRLPQLLPQLELISYLTLLPREVVIDAVI
jgi:hypothetical protein